MVFVAFNKNVPPVHEFVLKFIAHLIILLLRFRKHATVLVLKKISSIFNSLFINITLCVVYVAQLIGCVDVIHKGWLSNECCVCNRVHHL